MSNPSEEKNFLLHLQASLHSCSYLKKVLTTQKRFFFLQEILWTLTYSDNVGEKPKSAPLVNVS